MSRTTGIVAVCVVAACLLASASTAPAGTDACRQRSRTVAHQIARQHVVSIDADAIERRDDDRVMIFTGSVVFMRRDLVLCADRFELYLDDERTDIVRTVAVGNVRVITGDCREGAARRAEFRDHQRLVLSGNARLSPDEGWPRGEDIFIYLAGTPLTSASRC
jgi:lipopolysaccharide transport protein LptA